MTDLVARGRVSLLRHTWANTTWRTVPTTIDALIAVCKISDRLTVAEYPTVKDAYNAIKKSVGKTSAADPVIDKLLLSGERWGILKFNAKAALAGERWLHVTPSGKTLAESTNPYSAAVWLLVNSPVEYSDKKFNRPGVAILTFAQECSESIGYFTGGEFTAFVATTPGELNWTGVIRSIRLARDKSKTDHELVINALKRDRSNKHILKKAETEIADIFCEVLTEVGAEARLRSVISVLAPGARKSRRDGLIAELTPYVVAGKLKEASKSLQNSIIDAAAVSEIDYCTAALKIYVQLGLLERRRNMETGVDEYRITELGRSVLADCRPLAKTFGKEYLRISQRTTLPDYSSTDTKRSRLEGLVRELKNDAQMRELHAKKLDWESLHEGMRNSGGYELTVALAILCTVEVASDFDVSTGIRTCIDADLQATSHAPGGDADAVIPLSNGDLLLVQSTGTTGEAQVDMESTSVARHHEVAAGRCPGQRAVSVLVAPEVAPQFVTHHLGGEAWRGAHPKILLALSEDQLRRILVAGGRLEQLVERVAETFRRIGEAPLSRIREACQHYLDDIEAGVREIELGCVRHIL